MQYPPARFIASDVTGVSQDLWRAGRMSLAAGPRGTRNRRVTSGCAVNRPESSANVNGNACFCLYPDFCNHECEGGVKGKSTATVTIGKRPTNPSSLRAG